MKPHAATNTDRDNADVNAEHWPEQDSPADNRGLPGYPPGNNGGEQRDPELGFDPDSPDLNDPQVDPPHPPKIPDDAPDPRAQRRAPSDQYPPYEKP